MNPHRIPRGRRPAVASVLVLALAALVPLAGCARSPGEMLGPSQEAPQFRVDSGTSDPLAAPSILSRWKSPRITVWTDGWRRVQGQPGVSLEPGRAFDLEIPEQQPVTLHWSARPMSAQGEVIGSRWALDMEDIFDETPRAGSDDVTHWSSWSLAETSATVGPFDAGPESPATHFLDVQARDDFGFVSMVVIRLRVVPASAEELEGLPLTRR